MIHMRYTVLQFESSPAFSVARPRPPNLKRPAARQTAAPRPPPSGAAGCLCSFRSGPSWQCSHVYTDDRALSDDDPRGRRRETGGGHGLGALLDWFRRGFSRRRVVRQPVHILHHAAAPVAHGGFRCERAWDRRLGSGGPVDKTRPPHRLPIRHRVGCTGPRFSFATAPHRRRRRGSTGAAGRLVAASLVTKREHAFLSDAGCRLPSAGDDGLPRRRARGERPSDAGAPQRGRAGDAHLAVRPGGPETEGSHREGEVGALGRLSSHSSTARAPAGGDSDLRDAPKEGKRDGARVASILEGHHAVAKRNGERSGA